MSVARVSRTTVTLIWPGVLHGLFDLLADVARQAHGAEVVDRLRLDQDANLAACLDGEGLVDAAEAVGDAFQLLQALDVGLQRLHASAGASTADRVGDLRQERLDAVGRDFLVVRLDAVRDGLGDAVAAGQLGAEDGVRALELAVDRLADVVQQGATAHDVDVGADFARQQGADLGRLDGVHELVLAVAGAVLEPAEGADDLGVKAGAVRLQHRLFAGLLELVLDVLARLLDDLFDARRVDAAVRHEAGQGEARDLAADAVEGREHDGVRRVVDDQVDAGGVLEGADVAALAADDAALHVLGGDRHDRDGRFGDGLGGDALHRGGEDLAGLGAGVLLDLLFDLTHEAVGLLAHLGLHLGHEQGAGFALRQVGDALQLGETLTLQLFDDLTRLFDLLLALRKGRVAAVDGLLLAVDVLFALRDALFEAQHVLAHLFGLVFGLAADADGFFFSFEEELFFLCLRFCEQAFGVGFSACELGLFPSSIKRESDESPYRQRDHHNDDHDNRRGHCEVPFRFRETDTFVRTCKRLFTYS